MKDVMLDFETFGNGKNACVVQIGACYFDRFSGEIFDTFSVNVDARRSGGDLDADTVYWWLSQSKEAINTLFPDQVSELDAFIRLNNFLSGADCIWSHATFDFVILSETLKRLKVIPSFQYRATRDIRTLMDLAGNPKFDKPRTGVHHNGLDDCKYQVAYCVDALNRIKL